MAFSNKQRQLRTWGKIFNIPFSDLNTNQPRASLKYWAKVNKMVADIGNSLGEEKYLQVNFDQLCHQPDQIISELVLFLDLDIDQETRLAAQKLPRIPDSIGRYKNHDLNQFDPEDLTIVKTFGFII